MDIYVSQTGHTKLTIKKRRRSGEQKDSGGTCGGGSKKPPASVADNTSYDDYTQVCSWAAGKPSSPVESALVAGQAAGSTLKCCMLELSPSSLVLPSPKDSGVDVNSPCHRGDEEAAVVSCGAASHSSLTDSAETPPRTESRSSCVTHVMAPSSEREIDEVSETTETEMGSRPPNGCSTPVDTRTECSSSGFSAWDRDDSTAKCRTNRASYSASGRCATEVSMNSSGGSGSSLRFTNVKADPKRTPSSLRTADNCSLAGHSPDYRRRMGSSFDGDDDDDDDSASLGLRRGNSTASGDVYDFGDSAEVSSASRSVGVAAHSSRIGSGTEQRDRTDSVSKAPTFKFFSSERRRSRLPVASVSAAPLASLKSQIEPVVFSSRVEKTVAGDDATSSIQRPPRLKPLVLKSTKAKYSLVKTEQTDTKLVIKISPLMAAKHQQQQEGVLKQQHADDPVSADMEPASRPHGISQHQRCHEKTGIDAFDHGKTKKNKASKIRPWQFQQSQRSYEEGAIRIGFSAKSVGDPPPPLKANLVRDRNSVASFFSDDSSLPIEAEQNERLCMPSDNLASSRGSQELRTVPANVGVKKCSKTSHSKLVPVMSQRSALEASDGLVANGAHSVDDRLLDRTLCVDLNSKSRVMEETDYRYTGPYSNEASTNSDKSNESVVMTTDMPLRLSSLHRSLTNQQKRLEECDMDRSYSDVGESRKPLSSDADGRIGGCEVPPGNNRWKEPAESADDQDVRFPKSCRKRTTVCTSISGSTSADNASKLFVSKPCNNLRLKAMPSGDDSQLIRGCDTDSALSTDDTNSCHGNILPAPETTDGIAQCGLGAMSVACPTQQGNNQHCGSVPEFHSPGRTGTSSAVSTTVNVCEPCPTSELLDTTSRPAIREEQQKLFTDSVVFPGCNAVVSEANNSSVSSGTEKRRSEKELKKSRARGGTRRVHLKKEVQPSVLPGSGDEPPIGKISLSIKRSGSSWYVPASGNLPSKAKSASNGQLPLPDGGGQLDACPKSFLSCSGNKLSSGSDSWTKIQPENAKNSATKNSVKIKGEIKTVDFHTAMKDGAMLEWDAVDSDRAQKPDVTLTIKRSQAPKRCTGGAPRLRKNDAPTWTVARSACKERGDEKDDAPVLEKCDAAPTLTSIDEEYEQQSTESYSTEEKDQLQASVDPGSVGVEQTLSVHGDPPVLTKQCEGLRKPVKEKRARSGERAERSRRSERCVAKSTDGDVTKTQVLCDSECTPATESCRSMDRTSELHQESTVHGDPNKDRTRGETCVVPATVGGVVDRRSISLDYNNDIIAKCITIYNEPNEPVTRTGGDSCVDSADLPRSISSTSESAVEQVSVGKCLSEDRLPGSCPPVKRVKPSLDVIAQSCLDRALTKCSSVPAGVDVKPQAFLAARSLKQERASCTRVDDTTGGSTANEDFVFNASTFAPVKQEVFSRTEDLTESRVRDDSHPLLLADLDCLFSPVPYRPNVAIKLSPAYGSVSQKSLAMPGNLKSEAVGENNARNASAAAVAATSLPNQISLFSDRTTGLARDSVKRERLPQCTEAIASECFALSREESSIESALHRESTTIGYSLQDNCSTGASATEIISTAATCGDSIAAKACAELIRSVVARSENYVGTAPPVSTSAADSMCKSKVADRTEAAGNVCSLDNISSPVFDTVSLLQSADVGTINRQVNNENDRTSLQIDVNRAVNNVSDIPPVATDTRSTQVAYNGRVVNERVLSSDDKTDWRVGTTSAPCTWSATEAAEAAEDTPQVRRSTRKRKTVASNECSSATGADDQDAVGSESSNMLSNATTALGSRAEDGSNCSRPESKRKRIRSDLEVVVPTNGILDVGSLLVPAGEASKTSHRGFQIDASHTADNEAESMLGTPCSLDNIDVEGKYCASSIISARVPAGCERIVENGSFGVSSSELCDGKLFDVSTSENCMAVINKLQVTSEITLTVPGNTKDSHNAVMPGEGFFHSKVLTGKGSKSHRSRSSKKNSSGRSLAGDKAKYSNVTSKELDAGKMAGSGDTAAPHGDDCISELDMNSHRNPIHTPSDHEPVASDSLAAERRPNLGEHIRGISALLSEPSVVSNENVDADEMVEPQSPIRRRLRTRQPAKKLSCAGEGPDATVAANASVSVPTSKCKASATTVNANASSGNASIAKGSTAADGASKEVVTGGSTANADVNRNSKMNSPTVNTVNAGMIIHEECATTASIRNLESDGKSLQDIAEASEVNSNISSSVILSEAELEKSAGTPCDDNLTATSNVVVAAKRPRFKNTAKKRGSSKVSPGEGINNPASGTSISDASLAVAADSLEITSAVVDGQSDVDQKESSSTGSVATQRNLKETSYCDSLPKEDASVKEREQESKCVASSERREDCGTLSTTRSTDGESRAVTKDSSLMSETPASSAGKRSRETKRRTNKNSQYREQSDQEQSVRFRDDVESCLTEAGTNETILTEADKKGCSLPKEPGISENWLKEARVNNKHLKKVGLKEMCGKETDVGEKYMSEAMEKDLPSSFAHSTAVFNMETAEATAKNLGAASNHRRNSRRVKAVASGQLDECSEKKKSSEVISVISSSENQHQNVPKNMKNSRLEMESSSSSNAVEQGGKVRNRRNMNAASQIAEDDSTRDVSVSEMASSKSVGKKSGRTKVVDSDQDRLKAEPNALPEIAITHHNLERDAYAFTDDDSDDFDDTSLRKLRRMSKDSSDEARSSKVGYLDEFARFLHGSDDGGHPDSGVACAVSRPLLTVTKVDDKQLDRTIDDIVKRLDEEDEDSIMSSVHELPPLLTTKRENNPSSISGITMNGSLEESLGIGRGNVVARRETEVPGLMVSAEESAARLLGGMDSMMMLSTQAITRRTSRIFRRSTLVRQMGAKPRPDSSSSYASSPMPSIVECALENPIHAEDGNSENRRLLAQRMNDETLLKDLGFSDLGDLSDLILCGLDEPTGNSLDPSELDDLEVDPDLEGDAGEFILGDLDTCSDLGDLGILDDPGDLMDVAGELCHSGLDVTSAGLGDPFNMADDDLHQRILHDSDALGHELPDLGDITDVVPSEDFPLTGLECRRRLPGVKIRQCPVAAAKAREELFISAQMALHRLEHQIFTLLRSLTPFVECIPSRFVFGTPGEVGADDGGRLTYLEKLLKYICDVLAVPKKPDGPLSLLGAEESQISSDASGVSDGSNTCIINSHSNEVRNTQAVSASRQSSQYCGENSLGGNGILARSTIGDLVTSRCIQNLTTDPCLESTLGTPIIQAEPSRSSSLRCSVELCSNPRRCISRLRRSVARVLPLLLPDLGLNSEMLFECGDGLDDLLQMISSATYPIDSLEQDVACETKNRLSKSETSESPKLAPLECFISEHCVSVSNGNIESTGTPQGLCGKVQDDSCGNTESHRVEALEENFSFSTMSTMSKACRKRTRSEAEKSAEPSCITERVEASLLARGKAAKSLGCVPTKVPKHDNHLPVLTGTEDGTGVADRVVKIENCYAGGSVKDKCEESGGVRKNGFVSGSESSGHCGDDESDECYITFMQLSRKKDTNKAQNNNCLPFDRLQKVDNCSTLRKPVNGMSGRLSKNGNRVAIEETRNAGKCKVNNSFPQHRDRAVVAGKVPNVDNSLRRDVPTSRDVVCNRPSKSDPNASNVWAKMNFLARPPPLNTSGAMFMKTSLPGNMPPRSSSDAAFRFRASATSTAVKNGSLNPVGSVGNGKRKTVADGANCATNDTTGKRFNNAKCHSDASKTRHLDSRDSFRTGT